jgi:ATP-dependent DNA helicase DinG
MVVITKLPFDVPSDPVFQAKSEQIQARGGNPFYELSVPEAVIRLRQGFGRLIRNRTDRGAVLILDNRISTKSYGQVFINSLPVKAATFANNEEMWEALDRWFL